MLPQTATQGRQGTHPLGARPLVVGARERGDDLEEAPAGSNVGDGGVGRDIEHGEEVGDVAHHRPVANEEGLPDLLVTLPVYQQTQHLLLSRGQAKPLGRTRRDACVRQVLEHAAHSACGSMLTE